MTAIKNIIFDLGGVLVNLDRGRCAEAFRAIGFPQAEQMLSNYHPSGILQQLETGLISDAEFYEYVRAHSPLAPTDRQIQDALNSFVVGLPEYKLQMLLDLRERFGVYLLSNTSHPMFPVVAERYFCNGGRTLGDYFDGVFLSYEMKVMKPDEAIFTRMLAEAGIEAGESLFIDDGAANIEAASRLGLHTYLASDGEDFRGIFTDL